MKGLSAVFVAILSVLAGVARSDDGLVLVLVVEGLTDGLLSRVATPAIDSLIATGVMLNLEPEFPAETLPTIQSMVTGKHSEQHGVIDTEVEEAGETVTYKQGEFWNYNPNISTIWRLNEDNHHKTGSVWWPGTHCHPVDNQTNINIQIWNEKDNTNNNNNNTNININIKNQTKHVDKRSIDVDTEIEEDNTRIDDYRLEEEDEIKITNNDENRKDNITEGDDMALNTLDFNQATDQEWKTWNSQIQRTIDWLSDGKTNLVLFFVKEPGTAIRSFGPESKEAENAVVKVDMMVGNLMQKLGKNNLYEKLDIIVTGVHGFTEVSTENVIEISSLIGDSGSFSAFGHSPVLNIHPSAGKDLDVYAGLSQAQGDKYNVYTKNLVPDYFFYKNNERVAPIVMVAREGQVFSSSFWGDIKALNEKQGRAQNLDNKYGFAGYDNRLESMQSVVILRGPGIQNKPTKSNQRQTIKAVDIFPLVCHLLDITPPDNNGSLAIIQHYLHNAPPNPTIHQIKKLVKYYTNKQQLPLTVSLLAGTIMIMLCLICVSCCTIKRKRRLRENSQYKYSQIKNNRSGGENDQGEGDKVHLLTSAIMEEDEDELPI